MSDLFAKEPRDLIGEAIEIHKPEAIYVGFSGGDDSLAVAHWMINNVPQTRLFNIDTGVGTKASAEHINATADRYGWHIEKIRALEDCGQDYDWIVRQWGFPGPYGHRLCYQRLKERAVALLVRRTKTHRKGRILLATGIREDESLIRSGYKGNEINREGARVWVNPIYWWPKDRRDDYLRDYQLVRNPVSRVLGISDECMCGAYAQPGEHDRLRKVDEALALRFDRLHDETKNRFPWKWEERPPREKESRDALPPVGALCIGCEKSSIVQEELAL